MKIPWAKPEIDNIEIQEVLNLFKKNRLTMGPKVNLFEKKMAKYCNAKYAIAVSNGTIALDIALKSIGLNAGDEVIMPAMSYFSSASSVSYQNAIPVFIDIENDSFNLDPYKIENAISKRTKAIMFIDYGGNPSNFNQINKIAKKNNLIVIQDGAQSLGAKKNNIQLGNNGDVSTMSFHMAKILTTVEGGMIFTNKKKYYKEALIRRNIGEPKNNKYHHVLLGTNARMTEIQASIGIAQLKKLKNFLLRRKKVANKFLKLFKKENLKLNTLKKRGLNYKNSFFFFPIFINNRDKIAKKLRNKFNIDTRIAYPMPIYDQKLYKDKICKYKKMNCPNAESFCKKVLNLPMYPSMTDNEIFYIVKCLKELLNEN